MIEHSKHRIQRLLYGGAFLVLLSLIVSLIGCPSNGNITGKKVMVLAIDGMDGIILSDLMERGKMPNFSRLAKQGCFYKLGTSIPPQSPVAWSNFITGKDPGGHGIFDFIHRIPETMGDPETMKLYLSTSDSSPPAEKFKIGPLSVTNDFHIPFSSYHLPFSGGDITLMRRGKAFWEYLDEAGIESSIIKAPSNYPPVKAGSRSISGMGTPDLQGSYGNFSFFCSTPPAKKQEIAGGKIYTVDIFDNTIESLLYGPPNTFKDGNPDLTIPFTVYLDRENLVGKIVLPDREILLNQGEWSDWVQIEFEAIPLLQGLTGICKFYLKEVAPEFKLYVTPLNIDPSNAALPITYPEDYARELYDRIGLFYTQGMAEDTNALANEVLTNEEFLHQSNFVYEERMKMFQIEMERFLNMKQGFLFFYFSTLDQNSHVFWRTMDHKSPAYNPERDSDFTEVMEQLYQKMDDILGMTLAQISEETTLIVMSDHGFAPFYRAFQLNSWLLENGYITLSDPSKREESELFHNVDWSRTRAYALGLNGLYINLRGREKKGIVSNGPERDGLVERLIYELKEIRDPENGQQVILDVFDTRKEYTGPYTDQAPDLIIGYNRGYRSAWENAMGAFPTQLIKDNTNAWSGDHCVSPNVVPAVFLSNNRTRIINPKLQDLAPTILAEFGLPVPADMIGQPLY